MPSYLNSVDTDSSAGHMTRLVRCHTKTPVKLFLKSWLILVCLLDVSVLQCGASVCVRRGMTEVWPPVAFEVRQTFGESERCQV